MRLIGVGLRWIYLDLVFILRRASDGVSSSDLTDSVGVGVEWISLDPVLARWGVRGGVSTLDLAGFFQCWSLIDMFGSSICSSSVVCL